MLVRSALATLVSEKPYEDIVVKEILHRANIGRSTFYTRFGDKDELLLSCIHDMLRRRNRLVRGEPRRSRPSASSGSVFQSSITSRASPCQPSNHGARRADGRRTSSFRTQSLN
jgi:AcrR family transcriptional regulator